MSYSGYPNYSELLSDYIENSDLSIGEIVRRLQEEKGVKVDRSYISMLKNGKTKNPASDVINRAIAEVTNRDPDKLVYAAYVEKAPEEVRDLLSMLGNVDYLLDRILLPYARTLLTSGEINSDDPSIKTIASALNHYDELNVSDKFKLLDAIVTSAKTREIDTNKLLLDSFPKLTEEEEKKNEQQIKEYYMDYISVLTTEDGDFFPGFKKELSDFAKANNIPLKTISTPVDVGNLLMSKFEKKVGLKSALFKLVQDAHNRYVSSEFRFPGLHINVKLELDKWLRDGSVTYKNILLSHREKELIMKFIDALIDEKLNQIGD